MARPATSTASGAVHGDAGYVNGEVGYVHGEAGSGFVCVRP
jgi:hypothetical protein